MNMHKFLSTILLAAAIFLLAACQVTTPAAPTAVPTAAVPTTPPATAAPTAAPTGITLDVSGVAQDVSVETVPAVAASAGGPTWDVAPEFRRLTLQGYPVAQHMHKPQVFVYPVAEMAASNEGLGTMLANLQALLQSRQPGEYLPFLPLFNATQVMHAQVQFLDFQNGSGVRFLTQFDQAPLPINNNELFYTFQGLTSDGKYYVAAVLPVTHPDLPAGSQVTQEQADAMNDFPGYLAKLTDLLNGQPPERFTPDLSKLDAMIRSLAVYQP